MVVMVALLRGVNVGGSGALRMADLRAIATGVGFEQVRSYIQSGNLVFSTPRGSTKQVAARLRKAIADAGEVDPEVIVRSRAELAQLVADNPFLARGEHPAKLHVLFLEGPAAATIDGLDAARRLPEEVIAVGRELHLLLPGGVGRSKLATDVARHLGATGTMRGWRTVLKLQEVADDLA
ncbi:MAG: DUF1697 domain-containing protein [Acidimicrobiales bacterium]